MCPRRHCLQMHCLDSIRLLPALHPECRLNTPISFSDLYAFYYLLLPFYCLGSWTAECRWVKSNEYTKAVMGSTLPVYHESHIPGRFYRHFYRVESYRTGRKRFKSVLGRHCVSDRPEFA